MFSTARFSGGPFSGGPDVPRANINRQGNAFGTVVLSRDARATLFLAKALSCKGKEVEFAGTR